MFYSKMTGGFYCTEIHGSNMPSDVHEISDDVHKQMMDGQAVGKIITADSDGMPVLIDPPVEVFVAVNPVEKLKQFFAANPDVAALVAGDTAPGVPELTLVVQSL
jgi:hypothetical protein